MLLRRLKNSTHILMHRDAKYSLWYLVKCATHLKTLVLETRDPDPDEIYIVQCATSLYDGGGGSLLRKLIKTSS
jgi:hypothetical protein